MGRPFLWCVIAAPFWTLARCRWCGPQEWPTGHPDVENYWTSACSAAATKTLTLSNNVKIEAVAKCDCKPVRPACARVPHYVQHWGPDGEGQVVDIGRCLGRCDGRDENCHPKLQEKIICSDASSAGSAPACGAKAPCPQGYTCEDIPNDGCDPAARDADCPRVCLPQCDRFKVIVDCYCTAAP